MELPYELLRAVEELASGSSTADLQKAAQRLSERYRDKSRSGQPLLSDKTEAAAYAISRMPATFGAVYSALNWALEISDFKAKTLLDVGAGTGAATWAANKVLDLENIICVEKEQSMKTQGLALMKNSELKKASWVSGDITAGNLNYNADLVVASYVLNEVSEEKLVSAVETLWKCTNEQLLILEPGTPEGFAEIKKIRDILISLGANIIAPCPHADTCPICGDDWCHFTCRIPRTRLHKQLKGGEAPYEDEKFCYICVSKNPVEISAARVLRHPIIETGKVTLEICEKSGKNKLVLRKKDASYKQARKLNSGDLFIKE